MPKDTEYTDANREKTDRLSGWITAAERYQASDGWLEDSKKFVGYLEGDYRKNNYETKYYINTVYNTINTMIPSLYFQNPFIKVRPSKPEILIKQGPNEFKAIDGYQTAALIECICNSALTELEFDEEIRQAIQDVYTHTFGVVKVGVKSQTEYEGDTDSSKDMKIFVERICPTEFLFDPMATKLKTARFVIHRYIDTLDNILADKRYTNTEGLLGTSISDTSPRKDLKDASQDTEDWVQCYEVHDIGKNIIYTLVRGSEANAEGSISQCDRIIWERKNKLSFKIHFEILKFTGNNDKLRGISPIKMIEDQCLALNEVFSLTINHLQQFPGLVIAEQSAMTDVQRQDFLRGEQGAMLFVNDGALTTNRVRRETPLSMGSDYFNSISSFNMVIDRTLGIPDFARAPASGREKSATEMSMSYNASTIRVQYQLGFIKKFVLNLVKKIVKLQQQFYDSDRVIEVKGEFVRWVQYNKKDLEGDFMFDLDVDTMTNYSAAKLQGIMNFFQIGSQIQALQPLIAKFDPDKLGNMFGKVLDVNLQSLYRSDAMLTTQHDPYQENQLPELDQYIPDPFFGEDHAQHMAIHQEKLLEFQATQNDEDYTELARHIQMHLHYQQLLGSTAGQTMPAAQVPLPGTQPSPQQGAQPAPAQTDAEAEGGFTYNNSFQGEV